MASSSVFVNSAKQVIAISDDQLAVLLVSGKQQGRQFLAADDLPKWRPERLSHSRGAT
jgi:hypothetical protein